MDDVERRRIVGKLKRASQGVPWLTIVILVCTLYLVGKYFVIGRRRGQGIRHVARPREGHTGGPPTPPPPGQNGEQGARGEAEFRQGPPGGRKTPRDKTA